MEILKDMEQLLASDSHFLLGNWIESAKAKASSPDDSDLYEWNARTQISVWGPITVESVSCKARRIKFTNFVFHAYIFSIQDI